MMLLLAISMLSPGLAAAQQKPRPAPKTGTATAPTRPVPAAPASKDPFVGVWKLSADKSKYESGGAPKGFTRTYEDRGGGTIFMTTDVVTSQGTTRAYLVYKRDGKPYPEAAVGADSIRLVTVRSVDPRTEELFFIIDGKTSDKPSTISISPDGMTMTQVISGRSNKGQAFTNTVVYDKQP
jgi:hypothetical protein